MIEFKTNMTVGPVTPTNRIRQTVSGISYFRKVQPVSAELLISAFIQMPSGPFQPVLPNEMLLAEELEWSRIELEARRLVGSKNEDEA